MRISDWSSDVCSSDLTLYPFQHQRSRRLGAADDPGDTCARMRPRADEVKIGNRVVPIVGAEPGALPQQRFEAEGAAEMRREVAPEITRRIVKAGDEKNGRASCRERVCQ